MIGKPVTVKGKNLKYITRVLVGTVPMQILEKTDTKLTFSSSKVMLPGELRLGGAGGDVTHKKPIGFTGLK